MRYFCGCLILTVSVCASSSVSARPALNRVVGRTVDGRPLVLSELTPQRVGALAFAAGVPMGIETARRRSRTKPSVVATGRTLWDVLNDIVAVDPRYTWQEDNGVIVFRPAEAWPDEAAVLSARVGAVKMDDIRSVDAMQVIADLVGVARPGSGPGDTARFSIDVPAGSTFLDALNAIVRGHGKLAWAVQRMGPNEPGGLSLSTYLYIGSRGMGLGSRPENIGRAVPTNSVPRSDSSSDRRDPPLDRIIGPSRTGRPLVIHLLHAASVNELAAAVNVPMGVQSLPPVRRYMGEGVTVTGLRLGDALQRLIAWDPRYEWREMDGVIVFRSAAAWSDMYDALFRRAPSVKLVDATAARIVGHVATVLGSPEHRTNTFPDSRRFSIDLPETTVLDLLNAVVKAHGELSWGWEEISEEWLRDNGRRQHRLSFGLFGGGGQGYHVP